MRKDGSVQRLMTRRLLLVLPTAILACEIGVSNGKYTNMCGCEFSYFNGTTCWSGPPYESAVMTKIGLTVQNWPDTDLATEEDVCYTREYYNSVGASTALWPVCTNSVSVNCVQSEVGAGKSQRALRALRVLPLLALVIPIAAFIYCYCKKRKKRAAAAKSPPQVGA